MKNITTRNDKDENHGYQQYYWGKNISFRAIYKFNELIGYGEWHGIKETTFFII
jgi:hypothetical protein